MNHRIGNSVIQYISYKWVCFGTFEYLFPILSEFSYKFSKFAGKNNEPLTSLLLKKLHTKFWIFDMYNNSLSLPWNQETVIGYIGEIFYTIIAGQAFMISLALLSLLFISICWYHRAFFKMFQHFTLKLNQSNKNRNDKEFLVQLIRFHNCVKE